MRLIATHLQMGYETDHRSFIISTINSNSTRDITRKAGMERYTEQTLAGRLKLTPRHLKHYREGNKLR